MNFAIKVDNPNYSPFDNSREYTYICPHCNMGNDYLDKANFCPNCGVPLEIPDDLANIFIDDYIKSFIKTLSTRIYEHSAKRKYNKQ